MLKRTRVRATLTEGFKVEAQAKKHKIVMDLPAPLGSDAGPTPVDILLASLAGCIGIVARFHAPKHGIEIKSMNITVEAEYDTAGFEGEDVKPGLLSVNVTVEIESPNSEEEIRKFIEFVKKHCPIEDTLKSETPVKTTIIKK
ncbi:MAG: OsmC family protein [Desulfurococcales archaeon]|nr:OsmC family protein [Desulfurococcales archaeon]